MAYFSVKVNCPYNVLSLSNGSNCTIACSNPFVANYYSPCVSCTGTLEVGCTIYYLNTQVEVPTGYYSDGIYCYYQNNGSIVSKTSCPSPSPQGPYDFEIFGSIMNTAYAPTAFSATFPPLTCSFQRYNSAGTLQATNIRYIRNDETNGRPIVQGGVTTKSLIIYNNLYSGDYIDVNVSTTFNGAIIYPDLEVGSHPAFSRTAIRLYQKELGTYNNLSTLNNSNKYRLVIGRHEVPPLGNYLTANIMQAPLVWKTGCNNPPALATVPNQQSFSTRYVYKLADSTIISISEDLNKWTLNVTNRATGSSNFVSEAGVCVTLGQIGGGCEVPERIARFIPPSTSTSSNVAGFGSKTFIVSPSNLNYKSGDLIDIQSTTNLIYMEGNITSYNPGTNTLIVNITYVSTQGGASSSSSWNLSQINDANTIEYTGSIPFPSNGITYFAYNIDIPKSLYGISLPLFVRPYLIDSYGLSYGIPVKYDPNGSPLVQTLDVTDIFSISATLEGALINQGGSIVTSKGFQYSTINPIPSNAPVVSSNNPPATIGEYTGTLSGLTESTTYYVRAFAANSIGTGYGATVEFQTAGPEFIYYTATAYYCPDCSTPSGTVTIRFSSTPAGSVYAFLGSVSYDLIEPTSGPSYDVDGDFLTQVGNCNIACSG